MHRDEYINWYTEIRMSNLDYNEINENIYKKSKLFIKKSILYTRYDFYRVYFCFFIFPKIYIILLQSEKYFYL
jgi:hypothetical protein